MASTEYWRMLMSGVTIGSTGWAASEPVTEKSGAEGANGAGIVVGRLVGRAGRAVATGSAAGTGPVGRGCAVIRVACDRSWPI